MVTDKAGNMSEATTVVVKDVTVPAKPIVESVTNKDSSVTGSAEAGSSLEVKVNGTIIGDATAGTDGKFKIIIPVQAAGTELMITVTDKAGNISEVTTVVVKDVIAPANPTVNQVNDKDTSVTGTTEAGSNIEVKVNGKVVGTASAGTDGIFSATIPAQAVGTELVIFAIDTAGNVSEATTVVVKDVTAPNKPTVNQVNDKDTSVTGTAEAGSKVEVKINDFVIGSATAGTDGLFNITIPVHAAGTKLIIMVTDLSGNVSEPVSIMVNSSPGWNNVNGSWCYFDQVGQKVTGWLPSGKAWYFLNPDGSMQVGWKKVGKSWCYFENTGAMKTGWLKSGSRWYYFDGSGTLKTGWLKSESSWYYFDGSGAMKTGWLKLGSSWYYFYSSGQMAVNTKIGGYKLGKDGILKL